jgi:hypothetical protein
MSTGVAKLLPEAFLHTSAISFGEGRILIKSEGFDTEGHPVSNSSIFFVKQNGYIQNATISVPESYPFLLNKSQIELPYETAYVSMEQVIVNEKLVVSIKFFKPNRDETIDELYIHTATVNCGIHRFDDTIHTPFSMEYVTLKYQSALRL